MTPYLILDYIYEWWGDYLMIYFLNIILLIVSLVMA